MERLVGLVYVSVIGVALYYFWPLLNVQLNGTWFSDLYLVVAVVYVFAACWIFEFVWAKGLGRLVASEERVRH